VAEKYVPNQKPEVTSRKDRFEALNSFVRARHGWLTSIPGAREVTMECLPESTLPAKLSALGYELEATGEGERILPTALTEMVVTEGSTVARPVTHAGIVTVRRFAFSIP
jgi:hypothetical protein